MTGATGPTGPINLIGVAGSSQTVRARLNFIATSPIIITPADNPGTSSTDVTVALSTPLAGVNGGTGVANTGFTITLGGNLVTSGAFATTLTSTAATNSTLPAGTHTLLPSDSPVITGTASIGTTVIDSVNGLSGSKVASAMTIAGFSGTCNSGSVLVGDGTCGVVSSAFSGISSGANTAAAMIVGAGATLNPTSATVGVVNANQLNTVSLAGLATGLLLNTTTTGQPSIGLPGTHFVGGQLNLTTSGCVAIQSSNGILTCIAGITGTSANGGTLFAGQLSSGGSLISSGGTFAWSNNSKFYSDTAGLIMALNGSAKSDLLSKFDVTTVGSNISSADTIAPLARITHITGTTTVNTITAPTNFAVSGQGGCLTLVPDGVFTTGLTGNIAIISTTVVGKQLTMCYDNGTTKWYPSY